MIDRRTGIKLLGAAGLAAVGGGTRLRAEGSAAPGALQPPETLRWKRGFDNQRIADLGDGRFLNPLIAGDHPDPAILRDGADYYMTFSSFDSYPGLSIWHSRDLINWQPRGAALSRNIGSVWAVSLAKHQGRYFIYVPTKA